MRASRAGVVVLSCSDPRLNPYEILGIDASLKATMVRNAGGRVFDAIRTLAVLQTIGAPGTILVMHHTDCGLTHFHDEDVRKALIELDPEGEKRIKESQFGEITGSLREDVAFLKASPFIRKDTQIFGLKYDIKTGVLSQVDDSKSEL
ncbi:carbonic anhydrase [Phaeosphaeria sp. MPI-PUGE-AT-0046c]|nr:carbonic anhydrase [Phaeosphaeria sp. MPI-PUGE-AT-0046c]